MEKTSPAGPSRSRAEGRLTVPVGRGVESGRGRQPRLERASDSRITSDARATRSLLQNAVTGVTDGFEKDAGVQGVGSGGACRAGHQPEGRLLAHGHGNPARRLDFEMPNATTIVVRGIDKQRVGRRRRRSGRSGRRSRTRQGIRYRTSRPAQSGKADDE